ncbi:aromatic ring-hydroxylating dioxygenase subunit alpha [Streptomyces sp. HSW2009]|uniref:aromatic ring-hydroxylating oxygenase subunit alpha n=1 Tax=Streptomyces sp. HSW2009 TaxID=3142890 RepID=UPI0032F090F9
MTMTTPADWPHAPLPLDELENVTGPFGESAMLPAAAYTAPEVFAWEQRHLFAGTWSCLGRVDDIFTDGTTQHARQVGTVPVLLTRDGDRIAAFANTCRHRGHELLAGGTSSTKRVVHCPYHAWTFTMDGALRTAPRFPELPTDHGLIELPAEVWHGWIFVNASADAAPFADYLGSLAGYVAPYAPERLKLAASRAYEVAANWKVIVENYQECYHCPHIHPELSYVAPPNSAEYFADEPGAWVGGTMDLEEGAQTMSMDGRAGAPILPGVDLRKVFYAALAPNLLISLHPDYVLIHQLTPTSPGHSRVECFWYTLDGAIEDSPVDFWHRINEQDWSACESVQRGLTSPHYRPGPFAPIEDSVHRWVALIGRAYGGMQPWKRPPAEG